MCLEDVDAKRRHLAGVPVFKNPVHKCEITVLVPIYYVKRSEDQAFWNFAMNIRSRHPKDYWNLHGYGNSKIRKEYMRSIWTKFSTTLFGALVFCENPSHPKLDNCGDNELNASVEGTCGLGEPFPPQEIRKLLLKLSGSTPAVIFRYHVKP